MSQENEKSAVETILAELKRAKKRFPGFPVDPVHAAAVVAEEAGELVRAALRFTYEDGLYLDMMQEAAQVGAMAVRFLMHVEQMIDRPSEQEKTV